MGLKMMIMLLLAALGVSFGTMPGSLYNVSENDPGVQQAILSGIYSFNNQSNDAFLFKPFAIDSAQRQIVNGIRYVIDLKISRTVCHKRDDDNLSKCDFQPKGPLQQTFQCHCDIWVRPHESKTMIEAFDCKP
uniref:Cystatin domain-containing protein n=1 Tax=Monopterus albus TaxID=43700 RepID=A0A3Q3J2L1_MONAL|nr:cystatin-F [Monopterus albus]